MRHRHGPGRIALALLLALLLATLALTLVACGGGEEKQGAASPTPAATMSADEIVRQAEAAMAKVKTATFVADASLAIDGDPAKMTDPQAKQLLEQGASVHAEGATGTDPAVADMKVTAALMGQELALAMVSKDKKAWVQYEGVWYEVDQEQAGTAAAGAESGAAPSEQLKKYGLDPDEWGTAYELVGTEDLAGTQVYHVRATADPVKLVDGLLKASRDPDLQKALGAEQAAQLQQQLKQNRKQADELKHMLQNVALDYWIGVDDLLIRKMAVVVDMDVSGQKDMQQSGVTGLHVKGTLTMAGFDQPVTVTPPKKAKPFDKLMQKVLGGGVMVPGASGF